MSLKISAKAIVCQEAQLSGDVTVEDGTVIHPKVTIIAEAGPIIIGMNNILEEQVVIKNWYDEI
jgi:dynactin-6